MKNKLLIAGILLLVGGFMLGDVVGGDLIASVSEAMGSSGGPKACQEAYKTAAQKHREAVKAANAALQRAKEAKRTCMQQDKPSRTPKHSRTPDTSGSPLR